MQTYYQCPQVNDGGLRSDITMSAMLMTLGSRVLRAALIGTINCGITGNIFPPPA